MAKKEDKIVETKVVKAKVGKKKEIVSKTFAERLQANRDKKK